MKPFDPVLLNELKHHCGAIGSFIKSQIHFFNKTEIISSLARIGKSQMDLYYGSLTPGEISGEVLRFMEKQRVNDSNSYKRFLKANNHYYCITLSDDSVWILRWGETRERYIHIHPGRYSPHTCRVKAGTLKTAIAALLVSGSEKREINLSLINQVRLEFLHLPPVRQPEESLFRLMNRINSPQ